MGKQRKQWETLFSCAPKSLQVVTVAMKLKDTCSLEKLWQIWAAFKKQRQCFADKGLSSQSYGFSSSHAWIWELEGRKLSAKELMLLNCGVGEDSQESLGLQGDRTSQSKRKSVLNIHGKGWCWSWNSSTLATLFEELTHWKRHWCWERLKMGRGQTEDEMVGWHHWLNGHEFE